MVGAIKRQEINMGVGVSQSFDAVRVGTLTADTSPRTREEAAERLGAMGVKALSQVENLMVLSMENVWLHTETAFAPAAALRALSNIAVACDSNLAETQASIGSHLIHRLSASNGRIVDAAVEGLASLAKGGLLNASHMAMIDELLSTPREKQSYSVWCNHEKLEALAVDARQRLAPDVTDAPIGKDNPLLVKYRVSELRTWHGGGETESDIAFIGTLPDLAKQFERGEDHDGLTFGTNGDFQSTKKIEVWRDGNWHEVEGDPRRHLDDGSERFDTGRRREETDEDDSFGAASMAERSEWDGLADPDDDEQ